MLCGASLAGCASQSPTYEQKLTELRDKITILQNERDRLDERLSAVESLQQELVGAQQPPAARTTRPPLKMVVLKPDAAEAEGPTDSAATDQPDSPPEVVPQGDSAANSPEAAPASAQANTQSAPSPSARPLISGQGQQLSTSWVEAAQP